MGEGASHKGSLETFPDDSIKQYRNIIEIAIGGRKSFHRLLFIHNEYRAQSVRYLVYMYIETDIINMTYICRV